MIQPGSRLAHYEIISPLAKGGMGEVWRARDTKLGREVAIKTLPEEFARDPNRLARFEREAKLLASLNHPNIAAIHGLEEYGTTRFLVLELVEGETLADRIGRSAIPVDQALPIASQIAAALDAAHEKGVIHRDLKPANIKVTETGQVKVLDFGLAKALAPDTATHALADSPTLSLEATRAGVILGTAAYMSPEQAKGREVDNRADIWAFGCVLFEMLAGRPVFAGEDLTTIFARVVERDPDFGVLTEKTHPRLREILGRCLEKDPARRYHHIADVRLDLASVPIDWSPTTLPSIASATGRWRLLVAGLVVVALTAILTAIAVRGLNFDEGRGRDVIRLSHVLQPGQQLATTLIGARQFAVSPDGSQIVYATDQQLYLRPLDAVAATPIPGSQESPFTPAFSPDGQWIAYWSETEEEIKRIPVSGGVSETVATVPTVVIVGGPLGISWDAPDRIVYSTPAGLWEVAPLRGEMPVLRASAQEEGALLVFPQLLPESNAVLYTRAVLNQGEDPEIDIEVLPLDETSEPKVLINGGDGIYARYVHTGHLVYQREGALQAVGFDSEHLAIEGSPATLVEGVASAVFFATTPDARTMVYRPNVATATPQAAGLRRLVYVDNGGVEEPLPIPPGTWARVRVSPDGQQMLLRDADAQISVWDTNTGVLRNVGTLNLIPLWISEEDIIFVDSSETLDSRGVYRRRLDSSEREQIADAAMLPPNVYQTSSFHQAQNALLVNSTSSDATELGMLRLGPSPVYETVMERPGLFSVTDAHLSPDGTHVVLVESEPESEIVVRRLPDIETDRVSLGGGIRPLWKNNAIYFQSDQRIWRVPVTTEPRLQLGTREPIVEMAGYFFEVIGQRNWDVAPDGRLVMIRGAQTPSQEIVPTPAGPVRLDIVINWDRELLERVPVD